MSFLYDHARESFLGATPAISWPSDTIKVVAVTSGYVASQSGDQFLSTILAANRSGISGALTTKTTAAGVAGADAAVIPGSQVTAVKTVVALVIFKDTGTESTSPLIAYIDSYSGLPFNSVIAQQIQVNWPTDSNKIFRL